MRRLVKGQGPQAVWIGFNAYWTQREKKGPEDYACLFEGQRDEGGVDKPTLLGKISGSDDSLREEVPEHRRALQGWGRGLSYKGCGCICFFSMYLMSLKEEAKRLLATRCS